jgi:adenosyl cobinamide kinase/adenosyl cobinamide phosphate guanylyltransferase
MNERAKGSGCDNWAEEVPLSRNFSQATPLTPTTQQEKYMEMCERIRELLLIVTNQVGVNIPPQGLHILGSKDI